MGVAEDELSRDTLVAMMERVLSKCSRSNFYFLIITDRLDDFILRIYLEYSTSS